MSTFLRTSAGLRALRASASRARHTTPATSPASGVRTQATASKPATLPALPYAYDALEPAISGQIMELHHRGHHQTYVNNFNGAVQQFAAADQKQDATELVRLTALIKFNGGGHVNHSLFWENLAPPAAGGGKPPSGALADAINDAFGSFGAFQARFNAALAGIQGSGWAWLVQDKESGKLSIAVVPNQDHPPAPARALLGVDAWEHAYYLQYQNRKAEYFQRIWDVLNWEAAAKRFV